jgi:hypothetical protein
VDSKRTGCGPRNVAELSHDARATLLSVTFRYNMKKKFVMERTMLMLSEQDRHAQRWDPRQDVRAVVYFGMNAMDKTGLAASGQVIDMTTRGCGLRLTKPLSRGQYLTLKVYPDNGTAAVECDLVQVQWVEEDRAGVAFLCMSFENERRLHRLCDERLR